MGFVFGVFVGLVLFALAETVVWFRRAYRKLWTPGPARPKSAEVAAAIMSGHITYIQDALLYADGTYTYDDVVNCVGAGTMQFWPGAHSAVITEIVNHPQMTTLHIFLAGGVMEEIAAMTPHILEWGRAMGCEVCYFTGRKGWMKSYLVRDWGFADRGMVLLAKRLDAARN